MQMPISSASPSPAPAASSTASSTSSSQASPASSTASAAFKGKDNVNFNHALSKTMSGAQTQSKEANAQASGESAAATNDTTSLNALAALLGSNLSAPDLLKAIESLIQKLGKSDSEELAQTTTESDLTDALQQLENLLSSLMGTQALMQPALQPSANTSAGDDNGGSTDEGMAANAALLAVLAGTNASASQNASVQAIDSALPNQVQAVAANLEEINALKSGLQEALGDLKSLLQNQKNAAANPEQLALIGKQLASIDRLISGDKTAVANSQVTDEASASTFADVIDSVQTVQPTPQANAHLQRMAHRLLHVGVLNAAQKPEDKETDVADTKLPVDTGDANAQLGAVNLELQRQTAAVNKPNAAQPVPVQQFASTIQDMVVKTFNVKTVNGVSQAQLTLYPEHLGQVNVNISVQNGTLTAQFLTDTVAAKDMLENQMAQLRSALQSQGLQVDKLIVSQTSVEANLFQDRQGAQGQQHGSAKRNRSGEEAVDEVDFTTDLEGLAAQQAAARELGLGRGIHTIV